MVDTNGNTQTQTPAQVTINNKPSDFPEMPYSWNVQVLSPEGFGEMFTVRAVNENGFLPRVGRIKAYLTENGYKPMPARSGPAPAQAATAAGDPATEEKPPLCIIHNTPMKRRSKDGRSWWSCTQKLGDGQWCNYRPKE